MDNREKNKEIVDALLKSYWMEIETLMNYLACSADLDGVRAEEIKKALQADLTVELSHAQLIAKRVRVLGGVVPGSLSFSAMQTTMQPPAKSTDVATVIRGVIDAENAAINQYRKIISLCEGYDYPTQDMCTTILGDEEDHRREFLGFLTEYEERR